MKINLCLFLFLTCLFSQASFASDKEKSKTNHLAWEKELINLGEIPKGVPATVEFTFQNTSKKSLFIEKVKTSCGCTASKYPKHEIKPGQKASVSLTFNASKKGAFYKTAELRTNIAGLSSKLAIKGVVK